MDARLDRLALGLDEVLDKHDSNSALDVAPLLEAAARGDSVAWGKVVGLYARRVYALAKSRCQNHDVAEEITQSVLATLAAKLGGGEYQELGRFESWLFRVAMNRVRDHVRKQKHRPESLDAMESPESAGRAKESGQRSDEAEAELNRLRWAMARLTDADREIIELRHHGQMNFKEMAELLEEPMGTLLARHHRALRKLKELMGGSAEEVTQRRGIKA